MTMVESGPRFDALVFIKEFMDGLGRAYSESGVSPRDVEDRLNTLVTVLKSLLGILKQPRVSAGNPLMDFFYSRLFPGQPTTKERVELFAQATALTNKRVKLLAEMAQKSVRSF
jgi:hypothetical protein